MHVDWIMMAGLVGVALAISGTSVLPDFRGWCMGFSSPRQPLRWIGFALEFVGLLTDKLMATAFVLGVVWWSGPLSWGEVLIRAGLLTIAAGVTDELMALLHAAVRRLMGSSASAAPMGMPGGQRRLEADALASRGGSLTEEEAFAQLDDDDEGSDQDRGATIPVN